MAFDLFGSETKCDIKVGYISTDRGLVENIGLYEANHHAKLNPGAQFIFRNRDKVEYLNINEVNKLTPAQMLPKRRSSLPVDDPNACSGIVGLNLEGDTTKSHDDAYDQDVPFTGGSTKEGAISEPNNTRVNFYGGGGVGVQAVPVISPINGSVMSVIVTQGGYGYQYPPIVDISDDKGVGAGAALKAILRDPRSDDPVFVEEFDAEEDFEEYDLETCAPELVRENIGYGKRYNADGKDLGTWNPSSYLTVGNKFKSDPIRLEIERYQKFLAELQDGSIVDGNRIKSWWTTRQKAPSRITSSDKVTREKFDVQHWAWGGKVTPSSNNSSIISSNNNNSSNNNSSSTGTDFVEATFLVYTEGGKKKVSGVVGTDLKFTFTAIDDPTSSQAHSFQIKAESFPNRKTEEIKIKVKRNTKYNVVSSGNFRGKKLTEQGLLVSRRFGKIGGWEQDTGTSDSIFADLIGSADDDDDLQIQTKSGTFTAGKGIHTGRGHDSWALTYEFKDSDAFKGGSDKGTTGGSQGGSQGGKGSADKKKTEIFKTFMNQFAISPVPPSNVAGSDNAGKTYTFEWEEEIPWDGEYIFNVQSDNEAHLFVDNDPVGDKILLGSGGAAGHTLSPPTKIKKFLSAGMRRIQLNLLNHQIMEMKKLYTDVKSSGGTAGDIKDVTFKVNIGTLYAAGIKLFDENTILFENDKGYAKPSVSETHIKNIEVGKVYDVEFTSSNTDPNKNLNINGIEYNGLKEPGDLRYSSARRLKFDDNSGNGFDTNATFTIDNVLNGNASFASDGKSFIVKGSDVQVTLTYSWNDRPRTSGKCLDSIKIGSTIWTQRNVRRGSETHTITLSDGKSGIIRNDGSNNSAIKLRNKGKNVVEMEDIPTDFSAGTGGTNDEASFYKDIVCSATDGEFYNLQGRKCKFRIPSLLQQGILPDSTGNQKGSRAHVFNTLDWIRKANRKLWKMNPSPGKDANFINQFGILPFDPTPVAKIEKKVKKTIDVVTTPPSVNFEVGADGKNYLKVIGNGRVKVGFEMRVNDRRGISGLALREVKIQADDGEILMDREVQRGYRYGKHKLSATYIPRKSKHTGIGIFTAGKKYEIKTFGGSKRSGSIISADKTSIGYDDDIIGGYDENANIRITSITPLKTTKQIEETVFGYPDYPSASTDEYAGFHEIVWNNINFPESGNYGVAVMVDDNVELTFTRPNKKDIVINKRGFAANTAKITPTGVSIETKYFESGTYTLKAVLEQISGGTIAAGNVMGLAIDIKAAFVTNEVEVISPKSWNENPMGVAMTIDAPLAPPPREPRQQQEGRCPNNPIWTTRASADKIWYPVIVDSWAKFANRYAISPIPPLGVKGSDGSGTVYRNSWKVELPYKGFYGVKGTVDDFGKLFIDGVEVLGPNADTNFDSVKSLSPKTKKIFLEEKTVDITVEVENKESFIWTTIDQKVFSTADWASKQNNTSTFIEGAKDVDVTFKVNIGTLYAAGIKLFDGNTVVFENDKGYAKPSVSETHTKNIEVGKVYDVEFTSSSKREVAGANTKCFEFIGLNAANNPIEVNGNGRRLCLKDGDGNDCNASFTIDGANATFTPDGKCINLPPVGGPFDITFTLSWNDRPRSSGVAVQQIKFGGKTWTQSGRSGSVTHTVRVGGTTTTGANNNSNLQLRTKGKNVIEMEDIPDNFSAGTGGTNDEAAWFKDVVCSATDGEFYNIQGRKCKYKIPSKDKTTIEYGKGLTPGSSKGGVTYSGPPISTYGSDKILGSLITPTWNTDEEYIAEFNGKTWTMAWSGVDFPETGTYDIQTVVDDFLIVKIDGVTVAETKKIKPDVNGVGKSQFNVTEGKRTLEIVLTNIDFNAPYSQNPTVAGVKITRKVQVAKKDPRTGTALGKPWTVNPIGVSAILIPPPCPKKIRGVGIVSEVTIIPDCDGFDYTPPEPPPGGGDGTPVIMEVVEITGDPGINYGDDDQVCIVNKETGQEVCYVPPKGPFGEILPFDPIKVPIVPGLPPDTPPGGDPPPGKDPTELEPDLPPPVLERRRDSGFLTPPEITVKTATGIGYGGRAKLTAVIDPIGVDDPARLIQVTDLPGLKQTGYYNGKPYYGAVFYENGIRYAGYYDTPGQKVQIYDTMQESIDATVITPPSAIQRQGTDINSNDPRLNIPGTPDNLT